MLVSMLSFGVSFVNGWGGDEDPGCPLVSVSRRVREMTGVVLLDPGDPKDGPNAFPVFVEVLVRLLLTIAAVSAAADACCCCLNLFLSVVGFLLGIARRQGEALQCYQDGGIADHVFSAAVYAAVSAAVRGVPAWDPLLGFALHGKFVLARLELRGLVKWKVFVGCVTVSS